MKRYACPYCGFHSLVDPGERCPGCGYLTEFLKHMSGMNLARLGRMNEEIPIRQLACTIIPQDRADGWKGADCTITNKCLRLRLRGRQGGKLVLPYHAMTSVLQGTHKGCRARFFTYRCGGEPVNLGFFVDQGVTVKCPDIDAQVSRMVKGMLPEMKSKAEGSGLQQPGD